MKIRNYNVIIQDKSMKYLIKKMCFLKTMV